MQNELADAVVHIARVDEGRGGRKIGIRASLPGSVGRIKG